MERVMALLANSFSEKKNTEIHLVLIGINRGIVYSLNDSVIVHQPTFTFKNSRRSLDTLRTMWFIRSTIKSISPGTVLSFGEMWNNMVLLSLLGLPYPVFVSDRSQPEKNLGRLQNFLRRKLYPSAAGYIAQTEKSAEICREKGWNNNIRVIGNPLREIEVDPNIEKENIVLTVGRLIPTKHIDRLIRMFAELKVPDWKLVIVGGNAKRMNLLEELQELVDDLGVSDQIIFEGEQKNVKRYYNRAKIFAFTSSSEGFPNVIGEAMSAGLPVVAYDCIAGPSDLIDDGETGYLIDQFDDEMFKEKLILLMSDNQHRENLGNVGKESVKKFDMEQIAENFFSFITIDSAANTSEKEVLL